MRFIHTRIHFHYNVVIQAFLTGYMACVYGPISVSCTIFLVYGHLESRSIGWLKCSCAFLSFFLLEIPSFPKHPHSGVKNGLESGGQKEQSRDWLSPNHQWHGKYGDKKIRGQKMRSKIVWISRPLIEAISRKTLDEQSGRQACDAYLGI
ncbi:hypothetical protein F5Y08DRAFT_211896 [Xylaria arbuscula]|nr:hypothetical protein F5Y08DRAFT_211896 [Xylaria arbuscula]